MSDSPTRKRGPADAATKRNVHLLPVGPSANETDDDAPLHEAGRLAELETKVERLEERLRQAQLILDSAVDYAIITLDGNGTVTGWNAGARNVTGYADADMIGRSGDVIFTAEDRATGAFAAELRRAAETGRATNERWHLRRDGSRFWASGLMMKLQGAERHPPGFLNILQDRTELRAAVERRELLMGEMNHRIRNIFASVMAVAERTGRNSRTVEDFLSGFHGRLAMLASSSDMLILAEWRDASLHDMIDSAVGAHNGDPPRITIDGPPVTLPSKLTISVSLAFHELVTNAVKHGALSVPAGQVDVSWLVTTDQDGSGRVDIYWRERGGPPVRTPVRRGFGSQLLEHGVPPGGTVKLHFQPAGLECHLCMPLSESGHERRRNDR